MGKNDKYLVEALLKWLSDKNGLTPKEPISENSRSISEDPVVLVHGYNRLADNVLNT